MKTKLSVVAVFSCCLAAGLIPAAVAAPIQLRPAQTLQDGAMTLLPGDPPNGYAIPCVTDWNGDGKKDLLVGYQMAGKIALYLNLGMDAQPRFTNFVNLKTADGKEIYHPSSGCGAPAPWVCDFDGDGKRDLLVGAGSDGTVWFYRNTNTDRAPLLASGVQLKVGAGTNLLVAGTGAPSSTGGWRATPYFHDWDEDGRPDLLCGAGDGYVYFFRNTNTAQAPVFAPCVRIQAGGTNLFPGVRSVVRVWDWDGDGLKDLVCSSDTGVYWCRNTNSNSNPILMAPLPLCAPVSGIGLTNICLGAVPGARMRLDLVDWNNDGVMDVLVGNAYGNVYYFEGYQFGIGAITPQVGSKVALQWSSAPYLHYDVVAGGCLTNLHCLVISNLPSGGNTTSCTNQMQDVQFLRVRVAQ